MLIVEFDQDESVRLWNVETGICILIFAGAGGHRNEVLSVVSIETSFIPIVIFLYISLKSRRKKILCFLFPLAFYDALKKRAL